MVNNNRRKQRYIANLMIIFSPLIAHASLWNPPCIFDCVYHYILDDPPPSDVKLNLNPEEGGERDPSTLPTFPFIGRATIDAVGYIWRHGSRLPMLLTYLD